MKQKLILGTLLFLSLLIVCCSDDDDDSNNNINNLTQTPEAMAQFDNNNLGIYKGVFIGSSGIIIVNVNNDNSITATLVIDGVTHNFTTTQTILENQPTEINFVDGSDSFTFTTTSTGGNPEFTNLIINGHQNPAIIAVKETSTTLVKLFEGTFDGDDIGIFNAIIYGNEMKALAYSTLEQEEFIAEGTVENNLITAGIVSTGATFTGSVNGNNINGTWSDTGIDGGNGSWSGTRSY